MADTYDVTQLNVFKSVKKLNYFYKIKNLLSNMDEKKKKENNIEFIIVEEVKNKVVTEDLGQIFEKAICILYEIEYNRNYLYNIEDAIKIKERIIKLKEIFPYKIIHTASKGNQYDFMCIDNLDIKLSAKTTKKDGKVCPQVIGQPTKKKFCEYFQIDSFVSLEEIKSYIQENIKKMLVHYFDYTFDCSIIYFNKKTDKLLFINKKNNINWDNYIIQFTHIQKKKIWNESSTIKINNIPIGEFQVHNRRDGIKFRWKFENVLNYFTENFDIITL
jgi:hypothetical protein